MTSALHTSALSLPLLARGKVRDNYAVGDDRILMVASDRLSAFDVIMGEPIPGKGALLTQMALFWFEKLGKNGADVCPNHLTGDAPESVVTAAEVAQVTGRSMLVKRLKPLPVEAVVRGYLAGSGWKEYQQNSAVCGVPLPAGLQNASKLPEPIYTPAAKAAVGDHDENITFEKTVEMIGLDLATQIRDISIQIYKVAAEFALTKGIIIADTKFEFGLDKDGTLTLMDEVLTPDSSRYWPVESYQVGTNPPSYDKQFVRDWLEQATVNGQPWDKTAPSPALPQDVIEKTAAKYREALADGNPAELWEMQGEELWRTARGLGLGRRLVDGVRSVRLFGETVPVRAHPRGDAGGERSVPALHPELPESRCVLPRGAQVRREEHHMRAFADQQAHEVDHAQRRRIVPGARRFGIDHQNLPSAAGKRRGGG